MHKIEQRSLTLQNILEGVVSPNIQQYLLSDLHQKIVGIYQKIARHERLFHKVFYPWNPATSLVDILWVTSGSWQSKGNKSLLMTYLIIVERALPNIIIWSLFSHKNVGSLQIKIYAEVSMMSSHKNKNKTEKFYIATIMHSSHHWIIELPDSCYGVCKHISKVKRVTWGSSMAIRDGLPSTENLKES